METTIVRIPSGPCATSPSRSQPGEVLGIIGRNGAGKSTLLKILSRITEPTEGQVRMRGRVGSLLEVGTGFHPELTGRENIYLNGAILGMKRAEIRAQVRRDRRLRRRSSSSSTPRSNATQSGMYVRLAFAVAAHLEPEILIVDEVLAVGDAEFQKQVHRARCETSPADGRTVLFVSHNMGAVRNLCQTGVYLDQGHVIEVGPVEDIVDRYLSTLSTAGRVSLKDRTDRSGKGRIRLCDFSLIDASGNPCSTVFTGAPCTVVFRYEAEQPLRNPIFQFAVYTNSGEVLTHFSSDLTLEPAVSLPLNGTVSCRIDRLPLAPGSYRINTAIYDVQGMQDHLVGTMHFDVAWGDFHQLGRSYELRQNTCLIESSWQFDESSRLV